jgi:hypothetical protein
MMKKITWGASRENTLWLPYFENAMAWARPGPDWEWVRTPSGYRDSWQAGFDQTAAGDVPWIPRSATTSPFSSGWDGATGWRAFMQWAAAHPNWFAWHNDARNLYRYPTLITDANADGIADGHLAFRNVVSTGYAVYGYAQAITAAFTAANQVSGLESTENYAAWPGMPTRYYSIEARIARASGATTGSLTFAMRRNFLDASGASLGFGYSLFATDPHHPGGWVRYTVADSGAPPAGTVSMRLFPVLRSLVDGSATGSILEMRDVQYELGAFTQYVNSELYVPCYLTAPLGGGEPPAGENNGSRRIHLEMTSTGGEVFDGFTYN